MNHSIIRFCPKGGRCEQEHTPEYILTLSSTCCQIFPILSLERGGGGRFFTVVPYGGWTSRYVSPYSRQHKTKADVVYVNTCVSFFLMNRILPRRSSFSRVFASHASVNRTFARRRLTAGRPGRFGQPFSWLPPEELGGKQRRHKLLYRDHVAVNQRIRGGKKKGS